MLDESREALNTIGAAGTGSLLSLIFRWNKNDLLKAVLRIVCGIAMAYFFGPFIIEWAKWPHTDAYERFVSAALGIFGYSILELLMNPDIWTAAKEAIGRRIGKAAE